MFTLVTRLPIALNENENFYTLTLTKYFQIEKKNVPENDVFTLEITSRGNDVPISLADAVVFSFLSVCLYTGPLCSVLLIASCFGIPRPRLHA